MRKFIHKTTNYIVSLQGKYYHSEKYGCIHPELIENSNDWEEIIEKDYQILSFKNKLGYKLDKTDIVVYNNETECYDWDSPKSKGWSKEKENSFHNGNWSIHSVKRLSDGEIFTIGNFVKYLPKHGGQQISSFYIDNINRLVVKLTANEYLLESIKHSEQLLLTTEDGVDIFEGDKVWFITINGTYMSGPNIWTHVIKGVICEDQKYFSTKEAAENYIIMNKACLSLNDVFDTITWLDNSKKLLKELVKSKLNL